MSGRDGAPAASPAGQDAYADGVECLRVVFCVKAMNNPGGGAERVLADVTSGLAARGHEVTLLSFDEAAGPSYYPLSDGVHWEALGTGCTRGRTTVLDLLRRVRTLRRRIRVLAPDVAVGFMNSMYVPLTIALPGTGVPFVASEHIVPGHYRTRPLEGALLLASLVMCRSMTVVSDQVLAAYPRVLRRRLRVAYNPVTVRGGASPADPAGERAGRRTLLAVGRLVPQKDHATLIDAFARIAGRFPDWDLRIVGEGELRSELEERVARAGLEGRVVLAGVREDISREYARAQLFVMPSRYESLGVALAEAIAHGLPVVGFTDCPGVNRLIADGLNGRLVPGDGNRTDALADVLAELMADPARRSALATGEDTLPDHLRLDAVLDRWEGILREAVPS